MEGIGSLPAILRAFQATTGWALKYIAGEEPTPPTNLTWSAPVSPGVGMPLGHLRLEPVGESSAQGKQPVEFETARTMAVALSDVLAELMQTREALWQREAELAAGVPLIPHEDEQQHLASRLEAVLRGGAEAVGCHAAALYLLDEATTELKLRSCWGLPFERLTAPARPLQGSVADLEALLGHAVVLENADVMQQWKVPEDFPASVCLPVSTPTTLLGTLWVFCDESRDFSSQQTNMLEVVSGRIAADLEREMLMREGIDGAQLKNQLSAVERIRRNQLPVIAPLLDGWELAGWTEQAQSVGGDFYDWFCPGYGMLAVAVGDAIEQGLPAAMAANTLQAALRAHGQYHREAHQAIKQTNMTLWTGSAGDQYATLFYCLIETATGRLDYAAAGRPGMVVVRQDGWQSLSHHAPPLGESPETEYEPFGYELQPGEALVIFTDGVRDAAGSRGRLLGESGLAQPLIGQVDLSADQLVAIARNTLADHAADENRDDRTIAVVKRTPSPRQAP